MPAALQMYDSDGTTLIEDYVWETMAAGATQGPHRFYFKNNDTRDWTGVVLTPTMVTAVDGLTIKTGVASGTLSTDPLAVGDVARFDLIEFWVQLEASVGMDNNNPRLFDIVFTETP